MDRKSPSSPEVPVGGSKNPKFNFFRGKAGVVMFSLVTACIIGAVYVASRFLFAEQLWGANKISQLSKLPLGIKRQEVLIRLGQPAYTKVVMGAECLYYTLSLFDAISNGTVCIDNSSQEVVFVKYSEGEGFKIAPGSEKLAAYFNASK